MSSAQDFVIPAEYFIYPRVRPKPGSDIALRVRVANQNIALLPEFLAWLDPPLQKSTLITTPPILDPSRSPKLPAAIVSVVNKDTLDTALTLISIDAKAKPPLIVNMASDRRPGKTWLRGTMGQEESLCYRTSLFMTLNHSFYPLQLDQAIYSPEILVIRTSQSAGYELLDISEPSYLKKLACISVAALRYPEIYWRQGRGKGYATDKDTETMRAKMRLILRAAAVGGHQKLVLGALGCGVYQNPRHEVKRLWKEVLGEVEWKGWFSHVVFAVLGNPNFDIFKNGLEGMTV